MSHPFVAMAFMENLNKIETNLKQIKKDFDDDDIMTTSSGRTTIEQNIQSLNGHINALIFNFKNLKEQYKKNDQETFEELPSSFSNDFITNFKETDLSTTKTPLPSLSFQIPDLKSTTIPVDTEKSINIQTLNNETTENKLNPLKDMLNNAHEKSFTDTNVDLEGKKITNIEKKFIIEQNKQIEFLNSFSSFQIKILNNEDKINKLEHDFNKIINMMEQLISLQNTLKPRN